MSVVRLLVNVGSVRSMWNMISGAWTIAGLITDFRKWLKKKAWKAQAKKFRAWLYEYRIWVAAWVAITWFIIWMLP